MFDRFHFVTLFVSPTEHRFKGKISLLGDWDKRLWNGSFSGSAWRTSV